MATQSQVEKFFQTYAPYAQAEQERSGVPASVTLAQAAVESGYGLSGLAKNANNFFGIKADSSWTGQSYWATTKEWVKNAYETIVDGFRKYTSPAESFADHSNFLLNNKRYAAAFQTSNGVDFAKAVAAAGYATSPEYADTLTSVIESHDLTQYDAPMTTTTQTAQKAQLASWNPLDWFMIDPKKDAETSQRAADKIRDYAEKNGVEIPSVSGAISDWWVTVKPDLLKASRTGIVVVIIIILIIFIGVILVKSTGVNDLGVGV